MPISWFSQGVDIIVNGSGSCKSTENLIRRERYKNPLAEAWFLAGNILRYFQIVCNVYFFPSQIG